MSNRNDDIYNEFDDLFFLDSDSSDENIGNITSFVDEFSNKQTDILTANDLDTRSIAPKLNIQTKDKVSLTLVGKHIVNKGEQQLKMERKGSDTPVTTKLNVTLDINALISEYPNVSIVDNYEFDYYDKAVFDAFCSLINAGNKYVTYAMIARSLIGKPSTYHPTEIAIKNVKESIQKMMKTDIRIDLSEEFNAFQNIKNRINKRGGSLFIQDRLLNIRLITAFINGKLLTVLQPVTTPALLQYASLRHQISTISNETLNTPASKNKTIIACQKFVLQRICAMKSNNLISKIILFDSIYATSSEYEEKLKKETAFRRFTKTIQNNMCLSLEHWKKIGFIKDYIIHSKGAKKYYKIEIYLDELDEEK